jgi:hypothetical protein
MRNSFGLALLLVALLIAPSAAMAASTQCLCNNGKKMHTTREGEDACESVCDMFGGGQALAPEDDASPDAAQKNIHRRSVTPPAAAKPGAEAGTEDPQD